MARRGISRLWNDERPAAAIAALLVLAATVAGWAAIAETTRSFWKITETFAGPKTAAPSRLYGRPLVVAAGEAATPATLADRLLLHGYVRIGSAGEPLRAGRFRETRSGEFEITRRASPLAPAAPAETGADRLRIRIADGRVAELSEGGRPRDRLTLDPQLLATWRGADHRDRRPVRYEELPDDLVHAVLAAEDARFFEHGGIALPGIVRAAWVNLRAGQIRQGASTITQQLARLRYLDATRTWARKGREAAIAKLLEVRSSKRDILGAYLNEIYLGKSGDADLVGVGAASWALFGKSVDRLELHEAALIAALISSPGRYAPLAHPEAARARRDRVIARMAELGWITAGESSRARSRSLELAAQSIADRDDIGWFKRLAAAEAERRFGATPLEERGLTLLSTLDPVDQARAAAAVGEGLQAVGDRPRGGDLQAALVSIDPVDGAVRAYVGGRDFAASPFDRASQARRPAGSSFKPVVLAAALQSGASLADRLADSPMVVMLAKGEWRPRNFDRGFRGAVSVRETLEQSLNVPAARLALATGLERVARLADRFGLGTPAPLPALALGAIDTSPLALASAYSVFANLGARTEPRTLEAVLDAAGAALDGEEPPSPRPVLDPQTAFLVHSTLAGAVAHGTGAPVRRFLRDPLAGKTGTSDDERDSWFAGYSTERVTVVWLGHDDNSPTGLPGSRGALPIWATFTAAVRPERGYVAPSLPTGVVVARIDPESGLLASPDCPEVRQELFVTGHAPVEFCPLHGDGVVYANLEGSEGGDEAVSFPAERAVLRAGNDYAWGDVIALADRDEATGEPRIVIRRSPVARAVQPIEVARQPDLNP